MHANLYIYEGLEYSTVDMKEEKDFFRFILQRLGSANKDYLIISQKKTGG